MPYHYRHKTRTLLIGAISALAFVFATPLKKVH